jgi:LPXTG-motif cell wall-anchored protein
MKQTPIRIAIVAGVAAVALSLVAAPAAFAAGPSLASGSHLYAVDCNNEDVYSLDASTAAATLVHANGTSTCAYSAALDPTTGIGYVSDEGLSLSSLNLTTGVRTYIDAFTNLGVATPINSIAIGSDGSAFAMSDDSLYSLDLGTGELEFVALTGAPASIYGFAVNPNTGVFYTIDTDGLVSTIDVTTGELTTVGQTNFTPSDSPYSMQIDSSGMLWIENDGVDADLWSVNPVDISGSGVLSGVVNVGGTNFYSEALLLVPGPMAATATPTAASITVSTFHSTGFSARYTGFLPGEAIDLYISNSQNGGGTPSSYVADSSGAVTVTYVGLAGEGIDTYTLAAVGTVSGVFAQANFSVVANPVVAAALPDTGTNATPVLLTGAALLLGGAAFGALSLRRRQKAQH